MIEVDGRRDEAGALTREARTATKPGLRREKRGERRRLLRDGQLVPPPRAGHANAWRFVFHGCVPIAAVEVVPSEGTERRRGGGRGGGTRRAKHLRVMKLILVRRVVVRRAGLDVAVVAAHERPLDDPRGR